MKLGLAGSHQISNASLAVHLCDSVFKQLPPSGSYAAPTNAALTPLPEGFVNGLKAARWPGRCQAVYDPKDGKSAWFLDGAHTVESLICCGEWFVSPGLGIKE